MKIELRALQKRVKLVDIEKSILKIIIYNYIIMVTAWNWLPDTALKPSVRPHSLGAKEYGAEASTI